MICAPALDMEMLARIAELRARGSAWEVVAVRFGMDADELRRAVRDAGPGYRRLLSAARREFAAGGCQPATAGEVVREALS